MKGVCIFALLVLVAGFASGATVSGTAFEWYTIEPLENIIVEIDTVPKQTDVAVDGTYSFSINKTGEYALRAEYFENNRLVYEAEETVQIESLDGNFTVDLIMLPVATDEFLFEDFEDLGVEIPEPEPEQQPSALNIVAGIALFIIAIALVFWGAKKILEKATGLVPERMGVEEKMQQHLKNSQAGEGKTLKDTDSGGSSTGNDLEEALGMLKKYGGRMTQLELREKLPYGEAKVSLIVAELEQLGKIKKFKKGRGNIIILKE